MVTKITNNEYALYSIDPTYKFDDESGCVKFQRLFRERELIGSYQTILIQRRQGKKEENLCRRQVVKVWRRTEDRDKPMTMTFLLTSQKTVTVQVQTNDTPSIPHADVSLGGFSKNLGRIKILENFPAVELVSNGTDDESKIKGNLVISFPKTKSKDKESKHNTCRCENIRQIAHAYHP